MRLTGSKTQLVAAYDQYNDRPKWTDEKTNPVEQLGWCQIENLTPSTNVVFQDVHSKLFFSQ